jgi:hypothetical protein
MRLAYSPQISVSKIPSRLSFSSLDSPLVLVSSMELMNYNIHANTALYPHCPPTALPLDWDEEELPEAVRNVRGGFDLVVQALLFPSSR